jgi:hypothetical protein
MRTSLFAAVVLGFSSLVIFASPVLADSYTLKCNAQKDTVWVYDSLDTLNVQAKLSCGQSVEVVDRANGYARIHAANGIEGYIPEGDFANLPSFAGRRDASAGAPDVATVAKAAQAKEMAQYAASKNAFAGAPPATATTVGVESASGAASKSSAPVGVASYQLAEMAPRPVSSSPAPQPAAPKAVATAVAPAAPRITVTEVSNPAPPPAAALDEAPKTASVEGVSKSATTETVADVTGVRPTGDGACRSYFSAYGLTTNQLKWIEQNRSKEFAGVCPSPDVEHVNFVMIFTHDVDFYSATMPERVHSAGGFSDFRPMTTVDNALMSESEANKARHEYVWVFQVGDGGFDPNTFSTHRASQFSKEESNGLGGHGSQKTVEDAFRYVEGASR